jgi:hypothetical protein
MLLSTSFDGTIFEKKKGFENAKSVDRAAIMILEVALRYVMIL